MQSNENSRRKFLNDVGYKNSICWLYENKRHELLNEKERQDIYKDILGFIE
jgi:hypothetical protein